MRDANSCPIIHQPEPRWQPIEVVLENGHKHIAGYTLNPVWQMGKREPCPECERKRWK